MALVRKRGLFRPPFLRLGDLDSHHFEVEIGHFDVVEFPQSVEPETDFSLREAASLGNSFISKWHPAEDKDSAVLLRLTADAPQVKKNRCSHLYLVLCVD